MKSRSLTPLAKCASGFGMTIFRLGAADDLDVTFPPTDMPWKVREMHVRHPDGHVFRVSKGIEKAE